MSYFHSNYSKITYPIAEEDVNGLRNAQIGAIHAIGSHFSLYKTEPALIIMPTGSGKTAVLNLSPFLLRSNRVLVLTSSIMVRGQIFEEFSGLKTLKEQNVFNKDLSAPKVKEVKSPIKSVDDWNALKDFNVVVGIPNSINAGINSQFTPEKDLFDLILVDEAHHVPAFTWTNIVKRFEKANKIFFTATPFRNDKREIEGKIVFNYPLRRAFEDKIFGQIGYYPVTADNIDSDLAIAMETEKVFNNDKKAGLKHFIMVRAETKKESEKLQGLYTQKTNLKLKKIDSSLSFLTIKRTIDKLKKEELDGIICVDMLGEGFDFPNLKIAAIHSPKKSLATTLQFIGRFARTNAKDIGEAKFLAIPNDILIGKKRLYDKNAVWNEIIKNLSEEKIVEEDEIKTMGETFEKKTIVNSKANISFYNLNPYCHVKIYKTDGINLDAKIDVTGMKVFYHAISKKYNAVVYILRETEKPKWIASDDLIDVNHSFLFLFYDKVTKLLFINSTIKTNQFYKDIIETFSTGSYQRIHKFQINKVLADVNKPEFFNIGMQSRSSNSGESYRIISGSNAENTIKKSHGKNYANGHVFMKGISNGEDITLGYSSGSKVWSNAYLKIPEYIKWCEHLGQKIISNKVVKTNTGFDHLPIGQIVNKFPHPVLNATWHNDTFADFPFLLAIEGDEITAKNQLLDYDIMIDVANSDEIQVSLNLLLDNEVISLTYDFQNHYQYKIQPSANYLVDFENQQVELLSYLNDNSLVFNLDNFAMISDHEYFEPPKEGEFRYDVNKIIGHDWNNSNTDITREFYTTDIERQSNSNKNSIHDSLKIKLINENNSVLIYDHGTGEVADFITIKEISDKIAVCLYHVKGSGGDHAGDRVGDIYEVCMQAVKSQAWATNKQTFKKKILDRTKIKQEKFILGDYDTFSNLVDTPKQLSFSFAIVQPGISKNSISDRISYILAATDDSLSTNGYEPLIVVGS